MSADADPHTEGEEPPAPPRPERKGILPDDHWSKTRDVRNAEALEYLRQRSRAAGVAEGGAERNAYCMECHGVIPLHYDSRRPQKDRPKLVCHHCGAVQEGRVHAMFNWVETDEVPDSDLGALLPWILLILAVLVGGGLALVLLV
jgi:hypothetical protein